MKTFSFGTTWVRSLMAALLAITFLVSPLSTAPVNAETAGQRSTQTIILSGLAAAAAIILYNNYHHKQVAANTVVGYTRDGGVVHADGRITYPDGTVLYTGNQNRQRCSYDGYGTACGQRVYAYHGYYANQYACSQRNRGNGPPPWANAYGRRNRNACDYDDRHRHNGDSDNDNQGDNGD